MYDRFEQLVTPVRRDVGELGGDFDGVELRAFGVVVERPDRARIDDLRVRLIRVWTVMVIARTDALARAVIAAAWFWARYTMPAEFRASDVPPTAITFRDEAGYSTAPPA